MVQALATPEDINKAHYIHNKNTVLVGPVIVVFTLVSVLMLVVFCFTCGIICKIVNGDNNIVSFSWLIILGIIPLLVAATILRMAKKKDYAAENFELLYPVTYAISSKSVQVVFPEATSIVEWKEVTDAYDCATSIILASGTSVFVLPKRDFENAKQVNEVRKIVIEHSQKFTWCGEKRIDIEYLNRWKEAKTNEENLIEPLEQKSDESLFLVDAHIAEPEKAKIRLECKYDLKELRDAQWRFVTLKAVPLWSVLYVSYYAVFLRLWFLIYKMDPVENSLWFLLALPAGLANVLYLINKQMNTIPDFYARVYEAEILISNDYMKFKNAKVDLNLYWEGIGESYETPESYILRQNKTFLAIVIPKRNLTDEYKKIFVGNLLQRKIRLIKAN